MSDLVVIVCGDRNWTDRDYLYRTLNKIGINLVIHGGCRGADLMAQDWCKENLRLSYSLPADWAKHGKAAGPLRNAEMLEHLLRYQADGFTVKVIAFHRDIERSKGTKDMVAKARLAGVPVEIYPTKAER